MIIYVLTFYLFDDVKNIGITHANHSAENFAKKCTCIPNRNSFYLHFTLGIIHDDRFVRVNTKNNYFIQVKLLFWPLNLVTVLLFEEILVLTSF